MAGRGLTNHQTFSCSFQCYTKIISMLWKRDHNTELIILSFISLRSVYKHVEIKEIRRLPSEDFTSYAIFLWSLWILSHHSCINIISYSFSDLYDRLSTLVSIMRLSFRIQESIRGKIVFPCKKSILP